MGHNIGSPNLRVMCMSLAPPEGGVYHNLAPSRRSDANLDQKTVEFSVYGFMVFTLYGGWLMGLGFYGGAELPPYHAGCYEGGKDVGGGK